MSSHEETFYDVLKVDRKATISEIVAAYHAAKNAFSKDSVATYSLFDDEESKAIHDRLDLAFATLANVDKKREYDRILDAQEQGEPVPSFTEQELAKMAHDSLIPAQPETPVPDIPPVDATPIPVQSHQWVSGDTFREAREKKGLSLEDAARITKIPTKFIKAIENNDIPNFPARVYLQGFLKNLSALYRLDATAVRSYLENVDQPEPK